MKNNTFQKNNSFPNNQLLQYDNQLVRVLDSTTDKVFIIDCIKKTMPVWTDTDIRGRINPPLCVLCLNKFFVAIATNDIKYFCTSYDCTTTRTYPFY